jgi:hypothetical protein
MDTSKVMLDDLFAAADFAGAANGIAGDFRRKVGLPPIHQLGLVVPDVEKAAAVLENRGIGPFFIASGSPTLWRERDSERGFKGKLGIAYRGGIELELIEPGEGSDFYRRSLDAEGRVVVQHLGFMVDDVDAWAEKFINAGCPVYVRGKLRSFPMSSDFAYMDTEREAGIVLELITWRLFGIRMNMPPAIFHGIGRIEKLIGIRSLPL